MLKRIISALLIAVMLSGSLAVNVSAAEYTQNDTVLNVEQLAEELTETVSEMEHPYILYTEKDIPALKKKAESGMSLKALTVMKSTADKYMSKNITLTEKSSGVIGRQLQSWIAYLSLTGMLTGQQKYINKAVTLTVNAAKAGSVDMYYKINDALCVGDFGHAYALAYDWLYKYMNDQERELVRAEMEEIGVWLYENSPKIDTWGSEEARRKAWNWNAVTHGALGLIALSLGDKTEWMTLAIDRTMGYYNYAVDATGAAMEGLHYIGYALNSLAPLDCAIYDLTGVELLDYYPAMQRLPYWSMNMTIPFGNAQASIGQGDNIGNYSGPYYIINRYKQADALWGWEHTYGLSGKGKFSSEYEGNGWSMPAIIFFEDQSLTPTPPTAENNPLTAIYDKGIVISRDSWEKSASMITFTCGYGWAGCWNHPDDNTFTFYAKNEAFVVDLGAGKLQSSDHNVVLVDGKGMDFVGGPTMVAGDLQKTAVLENGALYLRGNNAASYEKNDTLTDSIRQLIYSGGETPYVIILDYAKGSGNHTYSTNFYTGTGNRVSVAEDKSYASIRGANKGELCYVFPYTPEGVTLSTKTTNGAVGISTSSTSSLHRQVTVFATANSDGSVPEINFFAEGNMTTVTVTSLVNGKKVTDTYVFDLDDLESHSSKTETTTEDITKTPDTEKDGKKNGYVYLVVIVALLLVVAGAAVIFFNKKRKEK